MRSRSNLTFFVRKDLKIQGCYFLSYHEMVYAKKTQRAEKIYKLLEKIGLDKIQYIRTYSANEISKFTSDEIQKIMDHFSNKPSTDFSNDQDNSINDDSSNQTDASEVQADILVSAEVSIPMAPIPLTHDSNSSGDSFSSKK